MLSLPSKPWKKVKIDPMGGQDFRITFLSPLESEAQFFEVIEEDLVSNLSEHDRLGVRDWPSQSVTLTTANLAEFRRRLVFACIMIEIA